MSYFILVLVVVLALVLVVVWRMADRLDRLHRAIVGARAAVDSAALQRAAVATELAESGLLDPASAMLLAQAAGAAIAAAGSVVGDGLDPVSFPDLEEKLRAQQGIPDRTQPEYLGVGQYDQPGKRLKPRAKGERQRVESDLSRVLRAVLDEETRVGLSQKAGARELLTELSDASYRLQVARSFHNVHVNSARAVRARPISRLLHLAGHAAMPETFDIDDGGE